MPTYRHLPGRRQFGETSLPVGLPLTSVRAVAVKRRATAGEQSTGRRACGAPNLADAADKNSTQTIETG